MSEKSSNYPEEFERRAHRAGDKITPPRRSLVEELARTTDHPTVEELLRGLSMKHPRYTSASIYRSLNMLEELSLIVRHDFNEGTARIEAVTGGHHSHLIDVESGDIVEFTGKRIEALQHEMAQRLGYELIDYKLEIYARSKGSTAGTDEVGRALAKRRQSPNVVRA